jgi:hypothetical protein
MPSSLPVVQHPGRVAHEVVLDGVGVGAEHPLEIVRRLRVAVALEDRVHLVRCHREPPLVSVVRHD